MLRLWRAQLCRGKVVFLLEGTCRRSASSMHQCCGSFPTGCPACRKGVLSVEGKRVMMEMQNDMTMTDGIPAAC